MRFRLTARCEWVRPNGGITQVLLTSRANLSDEKSQEQNILLNVDADAVRFETGKQYLIDIQPAFPHPVE
jgi:hypothetical protein